jgi:hypothetical protein
MTGSQALLLLCTPLAGLAIAAFLYFWTTRRAH